MKHESGLVLAAVILCGLVAPSLASAQALPPTADPGRVERDTEAPRPPEEPPPPFVPRDEAAPGLEPGAGPTLVLADIQLEGASVLQRDDLEDLWAPLVGRRVAFGDLHRIASAVTARYRNAGYVLSRAVLPAQELREAASTAGVIVRLVVIEGFIDRVAIEGDDSARRGLLRARAEALEASRPLRAEVLERYLLLIQDLPGVSARSILQASPQTPGGSDLTLQISRNPVQAFAQINSFGSKATGPFRFQAGITGNSLMRLWDSTQVQALSTPSNELRLFSLVHRQLLSSEGTTLALSGSYVDSEPDVLGLEAFQVEGDSWSVAAAVEHPVIRSRGRNLSAFGSLDWLESETQIDGGVTAEDKLRVLRLGLRADAVDGFDGINQVELSLSQGLPFAGATDAGDANASRAGGQAEFTKLSARLARLQSLAPHWNLLGEARAQVGFSDLLAPEEFGFGGPQLGRGFDSSEITGDHGLGGLLELQYGRAIGWRFLQSAQVFVFTDGGIVFRRDEDRDPDGANSYAFSAGGGLRMNFLRAVSGSVQIGQPINRAPRIQNSDGRKLPRVFFALTARY